MLSDLPSIPHADRDLPGDMELGAFSISLSVADLDASRRFYEALGFVVAGGDPEHDYLILKNGESTIGIFHGMFEGNILTFNRASNRGIEPDAGDQGPAGITLTDPDGNAVLIDQFF
jgi:catechol 2,3-dioxygenase-like lactoylglutathione lyase family enzyme